MPRRSGIPEPASRLRTRRPKPMLRSAMLVGTPAVPSSSCALASALFAWPRALEVWRVPLVSRRGSRSPGCSASCRTHRRRQHERAEEADLDGEGFSRRLSSAARQRALVHIPWAIAPGKPSGLRAERVHVDRVAIARDGGVAAPRSPPRRHSAPAAKSSAWLVGAAARLALAGALPRASRRSIVRALSQRLAADRDLSQEREATSLRMRFQLGRRDPERQLLLIPIGRSWTIRFSTWTSPTAPKGKLPSAITAICSGNASTCG